MDFKYNGNRYTDLYLFSVPNSSYYNSATNIAAYEQCKGYISSNEDYPLILDSERQARIHTCFSYCKNGDDENFLGDDRPNCVDVDVDERDKIMCLYPDE